MSDGRPSAAVGNKDMVLVASAAAACFPQAEIGPMGNNDARQESSAGFHRFPPQPHAPGKKEKPSPRAKNTLSAPDGRKKLLPRAEKALSAPGSGKTARAERGAVGRVQGEGRREKGEGRREKGEGRSDATTGRHPARRLSEAAGRQKGDGKAARGNPFPRPLGVQGESMGTARSADPSRTAKRQQKCWR